MTEKKKKVFIILVVFLVIIGVWGVRQYDQYQCTNIQAVNWQFHKLYNCAVYYNESNDSPFGGEVTKEEFIKTDLLEGWTKMSGAHIRTFVEIDKPYAKDKGSVYYKAKKVLRADTMSFAHLGGEYFTDKNFVFWQGKVVIGSQPSTFKLFLGDDRYGKDLTNEYFSGKKITVAPVATSTRLLLSPFEGEEVTIRKEKKIFWRSVEIQDFTGIAIALVDDEGGLSWLSDERTRNTGQFIWAPSASSSQEMAYRLIFYAHKGESEVLKLDTKNKFSIKKEGKPGLVLMVNFSDKKKIRVAPDDVAYISWASSNVERCYLPNGISQSLIGHMTIKFPQVGDAKVTEHHYNIECITSKGYTVNDSVKIEVVAQNTEIVAD